MAVTSPFPPPQQRHPFLARDRTRPIVKEEVATALDTPGPPAAGAAPAVAEAEGPRPPEPRQRRKLLYVTLPGCWGALIFACLSFTPSLLPRGGIVQGLVWGITAAIGYGLGVLAAWVWRAFADRDPRRPRRWAWLTFFITGGVLLVAAFALGQYWQYEIRKLMGVTDYNYSERYDSLLVKDKRSHRTPIPRGCDMRRWRRWLHADHPIPGVLVLTPPWGDQARRW